MKNTFGAFVREKRLEKKIGLREFAIMMELSCSYVSQMENCLCSPPSEKNIVKMAEILGINSGYLLARAGEISTENIKKNTPKTITPLTQKASKKIDKEIFYSATGLPYYNDGIINGRLQAIKTLYTNHTYNYETITKLEKNL